MASSDRAHAPSADRSSTHPASSAGDAAAGYAARAFEMPRGYWQHYGMASPAGEGVTLPSGYLQYYGGGGASGAEVHEKAARGTATPSSTLPYLDRIQRAFGPEHDVSHIKAHVGDEASRSAASIGAAAFAVGDHAVFHGAPSLHVAAHEAAHVVQQRAGVMPYGGVGREGDALERHADAVADAVVEGRSASPLLSSIPTSGGGASGQAVQRVGGEKFGIKVEEGQSGGPGYNLLKEQYVAYKREVKTAKKQAIREFQESGKMDDLETQKTYTARLKAAELTIEELGERLKQIDGFTVLPTGTGAQVKYQGALVATLLDGEAAFEEVEEAEEGKAAIYKKHTLDGMSPQDYIKANGHILRRYAFRGITPPERKAYKEGNDLLPVNANSDGRDEMGFNFDEATGVPSARVRDVGNGKVGDLEWLNDHAGTELDRVPDDPSLRAFMQTRKGVGRLLSARSTPRPITSNHGKEFTGFGEVKIDLAKVPEQDIVHSYKEQFKARDLSDSVGTDHPHGKLKWETDRANETVLRNRELVLSKIPNQAVVGDPTDTQARKDYENEFKRVYTQLYKKAFTDRLAEEDEEINEAAPEPAVFDWAEDHFTAEQGRHDAQLRGHQAGRADGARRVNFINGYKDAFTTAFGIAYERAAEDEWWGDEALYQKGDMPFVVIPKAPLPVPLPPGLGFEAGEAQGKIDGTHEGQQSGAQHSWEVEAQPSTTGHDDEQEDPVSEDDEPKQKSKKPSTQHKTKKPKHNNKSKRGGGKTGKR